MEFPTRFARGSNLEKEVGTPPTHRPLKIGETTYAEFVKRAGPPELVSKSKRYAVYSWNTTGWTGFWMLLGVIPLPAMDDWDGSQNVNALVTFDDRGILVGWTEIQRSIMTDKPDYIPLDPWGMFPPQVYAELKPATTQSTLP
jgi:hypothetical protein